MSRARTLSKLFNTDGNLNLSPVASVNSAQVGGQKNMIINGNMIVNQRGDDTSVSGTQYVLDRWFLSGGNFDATLSVTQSTDAPAGFSNSQKIEVITADSSYGVTTDHIRVRQRMEGYRVAPLYIGRSGAKSFAISFWVRSSVTGGYSATLFTQDNGYHYVMPYTINTADTWERKTFSVPAHPTGTDGNITTGTGLDLQFQLVRSGPTYRTSDTEEWTTSVVLSKDTDQDSWVKTTGNTFYLTGVQVEVGDEATDFEHRGYGEEFSLCERYYQRWNANSTSTGAIIAMGVATTATAAYVELEHRPMRAQPTISINNTIFSDSVSYDRDVSAIGVTSGSYSNGRYYAFLTTATGLSTYRPGNFRFKSSTSGYFILDAEL